MPLNKETETELHISNKQVENLVLIASNWKG